MNFRNFSFPIILLIILLGCSSKPKWQDYENGVSLLLEIEKSNHSDQDINNLKKIRFVLEQRLHAFGIDKFLAKIVGNDKISVQFPANFQIKDELYDLITKPYHLEFKIVCERYRFDNMDSANIPSDLEILYPIKKDDVPLIVHKETLLTGSYIKTAKISFDTRTDRPYINLEFNEEGSRLLEQITGSNIGKRLAVILDGKFIFAPKVYEKIKGGHASLSGSFSDEEVKRVAFCLDQGAYPAAMRLLKKERITKDSWIGYQQTSN